MTITEATPLIEAGGNLIGAGVQQAFAEKNMRTQRRMQRDLMQYQWDNQIPSQINAMKQAGLNVGLMYSGGGPSVSSSTGSQSAQTIPNPLTGIGEAVQQAELNKSVIESNEATAELKRVQALLAERETIVKERNAATAEFEAATKANKSAEEINYLKKRLEQYDEQLRINDEDLKLAKTIGDSTVRKNDAQAGLFSEQATTDKELRGSKKREIETSADENKSNAKLADARAERERFNAWYEKTFGAKVSSGMNAVIDKIMYGTVGTPELVSQRVNAAGDVATQTSNLLERMYKWALEHISDRALAEYAKKILTFVGDTLGDVKRQTW